MACGTLVLGLVSLLLFVICCGGLIVFISTVMFCGLLTFVDFAG